MTPIRWPALAAAALALAAAPASAQSLPPREGERFPALAFPDLDGELRSVADFAGIKVLLIQFASW